MGVVLRHSDGAGTLSRERGINKWVSVWLVGEECMIIISVLLRHTHSVKTLVPIRYIDGSLDTLNSL